jgi:hypothetical protein
MSYFFTDTFRSTLQANPTMMTNAVIGIVLFRSAPGFVIGDTRYVGIDTISELVQEVGWVEVTAGGYPIADTVTVATADVAGSRYVMLDQFPDTGFDGLVDTPVNAVAFIYKGGGVTAMNDKIIFVSDTPFPEPVVLGDGDAIAPRTPQAPLPGPYMFAWALPEVGHPEIVPDPQEGPLAIMRGAPVYEGSHTEHVWLFPQRVNFIANSSFEAGITHWRTNGVLAQVTDAAPSGGSKAGKFTGTAPVVAESNTWPALSSSEWTVQVWVRANGPVRVGLVHWEADFGQTIVDWGDVAYGPGGYLHIRALRWAAQPKECMLRVECNGTEMTIDNALAEPGYLLDWPYFNGDTIYGAADDFSWYAGENLQHNTYSLWYNLKRAVGGRLFARDLDGSVVTDTDMEEQGLVYQWVPAGTVVVPHWDVLFANDVPQPVPEPIGAVLGYKVDEDDDMGVVNPWD